METERPASPLARRLAAVCGVLAVGVAAALLYLRRDELRPPPSSRRPLPVVSNPASGWPDVLPGSIPARDFATVLHDLTDRPVVFEPPAVADRMIGVETTVQGATPEILRRLLEAEGLRVEVETLPDGADVITIRGR